MNDHKMTTTTKLIVDATTKLNRNLSELVKWSDDLYLQQHSDCLNNTNNDSDANGYVNGTNESKFDDVDSTTASKTTRYKTMIDFGTKISKKVLISFKVSDREMDHLIH